MMCYLPFIVFGAFFGLYMLIQKLWIGTQSAGVTIGVIAVGLALTAWSIYQIPMTCS